MAMNIIIKRLLGTTVQRQDIGQVFVQENVQKMLKDITRFEEKKIFRRRQVSRLKSPRMLFMTNEQLDRAKELAYDHAKARLQMPPVMAAKTTEPAILARDEEIAGYTKFKTMFIDISPGISDRNRLMSVREIDGTLREPTYEERTRLNHMFYPGVGRTLDVPKLFEEKHLLDLMKRKEYEFVLNRACNEFEPDDPRYVAVTKLVYEYINEKCDYDMLRSTRHFGPMSLHLAYNKLADDLICEMLEKNLLEDAIKLVKIYNTCHNIEYEDNEDHLGILKNYATHHSIKKYNLDLALQKLSNSD